MLELMVSFVYQDEDFGELRTLQSMAVAAPIPDSPLGTYLVPPNPVARVRTWMSDGYEGTALIQQQPINVQLTSKDMRRILSPTGWLTSNALYIQGVVLTAQLEIDGIDDVCVLDPYAFDQMSYWHNRTAQSVGRSLGKRIDFRKVVTVLFPAHVHGNHWTLFVWTKSADGNADSLDYYDSLCTGKEAE